MSKRNLGYFLRGKQGDKESVNEAWEQFKEIVCDASKEVLGRLKSTSEPRFNKISEEVIKRKNWQDRNG